MLQLRIFNLTIMSFKIMLENKILTKNYEFTVGESIITKGLKCLSFDGIILCFSPKKPFLY